MQDHLISKQTDMVVDFSSLGGRWARGLLWLCPAMSVLVAAILLWLAGLTLWTAVLAGILIGCPVALVFAWLAGRAERRRG